MSVLDRMVTASDGGGYGVKATHGINCLYAAMDE